MSNKKPKLILKKSNNDLSNTDNDTDSESNYESDNESNNNMNSLKFKKVDTNHTIELDNDHINRLKKLIRYQNKILLYELADHFRWNYDDLEKTYLS